MKQTLSTSASMLLRPRGRTNGRKLNERPWGTTCPACAWTTRDQGWPTRKEALAELSDHRARDHGQPAEALLRRILGAWYQRPKIARVRPLRVRIGEDVPPLAVAPRAVEQILEVLLDNALQHGSGTVRVEVRAVERAVAIDVADSGGSTPGDDIFLRGISGDGGTGMGLTLARQMTEDLGGRLLLSRRSPETRFTLLLPQHSPGAP